MKIIEDKNIGAIIAIIGGMASFLIAFLIPIAYPEMIQYLGFFIVQIMQFFIITGGIISIIGALIVLGGKKIGKSIILIGALCSGINIITIAGAAKIKSEDFYFTKEWVE